MIFSWFFSWGASVFLERWSWSPHDRCSEVSCFRRPAGSQSAALFLACPLKCSENLLLLQWGGPSHGRSPPMPLMFLLGSLNNVSGLQHVVICLDPQNHFFIQHLSEIHNLSNKSSMCLFFILQFVSQHLAFSWRLLSEGSGHLQCLKKCLGHFNGLLLSGSVLSFCSSCSCWSKSSIRPSPSQNFLEVLTASFSSPALSGASAKAPGCHDDTDLVCLSQIGAELKAAWYQ